MVSCFDLACLDRVRSISGGALTTAWLVMPAWIQRRFGIANAQVCAGTVTSVLSVSLASWLASCIGQTRVYRVSVRLVCMY
jgi:hypothetical protein